MRLSGEKLHFRGICIRIFSFLYMFYSRERTKQSEEEISQAEGSCVFGSLWLDPLSDILLLGCCPSVSDMHQSTPLPSGVGHQSVAPALFPRLEQNLCKLTCENTKMVGEARRSNTDGRAVARCCGAIIAAGSTHVFLGSKQNNRLWGTRLTLPWVIQGILFSIIFLACLHPENDSCCA